MTEQQRIDYDYDERWVAFIDILGFKEHVKDATDTDFQDLLSIIHKARYACDQWGEAWRAVHHVNTLEATAFSDNIVISIGQEENARTLLLQMVEMFARDFLESGYMIRGAVTRGRLHHSEGVVVGEGLVKAYELESKVANYPRVIIDPSVLGDLKAGLDPRGNIKLTQDFDGLCFVDYLHGEPDSKWKGLPAIRERLSQQLLHPNIGVRAKIRWMVNLLNQRAESIGMEKIPVDTLD